jgi:hypothetical protein
MKRCANLQNSNCLSCQAWLCVTAGEYTGVVMCSKCGAENVFRDSLKPVGLRMYEGRQEPIRRAAIEADASAASASEGDRDRGEGGKDNPAYSTSISSA